MADVGRLINVNEADLAELSKLERQYQTVTERMAIRERELQVQNDAGMLTRVADAARRAGSAPANRRRGGA